MAKTYNNTVPLGQAGTGAAYVLGDSDAANALIQNNQYNAAIAQKNALLRQQQAEQLSKDWQRNALKVEAGQYWQNDFNSRFQNHLKKGVELRGMGINPYDANPNDPVQSKIAEDYLLERQQIESDMGARQLRERAIADQFKLLNSTPDAFEPESIQELNNYVNLPFSEANKIDVPVLRPSFDPNKEIVPKLDPVTMQTSEVIGNTKIEENRVLEEPTKRNIETLFKGSQGGERYLKRTTGLTTSEAKDIPNTFAENRQSLIKEYRGNPKFREEIAKEQGLTKESPELDVYLNSLAQERTQQKQQYNSVIDNYLNLARAKANEFVKQNPDFTLEDQAMSRERLALARESNNRERTNFNERNNPKQDEQVTFRQQWVDDMWNEREGSGERLKSIIAGQNGYDGELGIRIQGNKINYIIPRKVESTVTVKDGEPSTTSKVIPGRTVTIDRSNANDKNKLNELLNDLTGETINPTKFNTSGGKGKVQGNIQGSAPKYKTTISRSDIPARAAAAGYSVSEYEKVLKQNGVKIQ